MTYHFAELAKQINQMKARENLFLKAGKRDGSWYLKVVDVLSQ